MISPVIEINKLIMNSSIACELTLKSINVSGELHQGVSDCMLLLNVKPNWQHFCLFILYVTLYN